MMKMTTLIVAVAVVWLGLPRFSAAQTPGGWRSAENGVEILALPAGWNTQASTGQSLKLAKTYPRAGLEFEERITVQVARDTYGSVENAVQDLRREGYFLVDRTRLAIDTLGVPFWFLRRAADDGESAWCALFLRAGRVYLIELRASALDLDALTDYGRLIENFRLLADPREVAWNALGAGEPALAESKFRTLLSTSRDDLNARYGLGLAYLAEGRADDAVRELERVRPSLGFDEDVRRPLGRAELARGSASRGVALLVQVLRDDPAWDAEVRPQIFAGIRGALTARGATTSSGLLSVTAIDFMSRLTRGDAFELQTLRADFNREFDRIVGSCLSNACDTDALIQILAAVDFEQAMSLGLSARAAGNELDLQAALARFSDGFKMMTLLAR
jgi:hypothetical protein